jgi:NADH:ubiquinone oxidoreductase subunit F (NADH-binding)
VETFAALPWILQHGGKAFAAMGTEQSSGTKLISLDHSFNRPGVHEVELGTPLQQVIEEIGAGFHGTVKAIEIGGPLGSVVPLHKLPALSLDFESFAQHSFQLGHAGMIGIPQDFPMIDFLRHLFAYMANESCGKCAPCRLGTRKGHALLLATAKNRPIANDIFHDLLDTLETGSLCGLCGGLPFPVRNILDYFGDELAEYFA